MRSICLHLFEAANLLPEKTLFEFPETRWSQREGLTYRELASRSTAAAKVISSQADPGDRALLLFPTGTAFWEAFCGALMSKVIAVPLKVPNLYRSSEPIERVCRDSGATLLLTEAKTAEILRSHPELHPSVSRLRIVTPQQWRGESAEFQARSVTPDQIAFLQYTSGSTSFPKGVQVSHGNLMSNISFIQDRMRIEKGNEVAVTWLPHFHDMGLVGSYLTTLATHNTCICLPPEEFALKPATWLRRISTEKASISGGPDFAYRLCVDKIGDEEMDGIDLSSWRVAYIGAERVRSTTLERFAERFSKLGFRSSAFFPCYGLGEATLMATGGPAGREPMIKSISSKGLRENLVTPPLRADDVQLLVGNGTAVGESSIAIVDPNSGQALPDDSIGEVLLSGNSVTSGYFLKSELNEALFRDVFLAGSSRRFLRTGDLGFLSEGELFITGRMKELIILRGRNLSPEDLEQAVDCVHEMLQPRGCVAFSVDQDGTESLIIATELKRSTEPPPFDEITSMIRSRIVKLFGVNPTHILLLRPYSIPRTSSGKLRRLAVRDSYLQGTLKTCVDAG